MDWFDRAIHLADVVIREQDRLMQIAAERRAREARQAREAADAAEAARRAQRDK
jgi:hypothetical protein